MNQRIFYFIMPQYHIQISVNLYIKMEYCKEVKVFSNQDFKMNIIPS
jgi:hypothetical protein